MPFLHSVVGHQHVVDSLAFSPDGNLLLSGSWDGTARLWDFASGELLRTFAWGSEKIQCVAWSPDGKFVAVGGESPAIQPGEEYLQRYQDWFGQPNPRPDDYLPNTHFHPSGVRIFEVETGTLRLKIEDYDRGVSFSPDGQSIVVSSYFGLAVFDVESGEKLAVNQDEQGGFDRVGHSRDGKQIAALNSSGVSVFDGTTLELIEFLTADGLFKVEYLPAVPPARLRRIEYEGAADSERHPLLMVQFCRDLLPDFATLEVRRRSYDLPSVVPSPGNDCFAVIGDDRTVCLVDLCLETVFKLHSPGRDWIRTTAFSPDGRVLASTGDDRQITVWDVATGTAQRKFGCPAGDISAIATSLNGPLIAAADIAGRIVLINVDSASVIATAQLPLSIAELEFSPSDDFLIAASECNTIHELEIPSLKVRSRFDGIGQQFVGGMHFPACGGYLTVSKLETVSEEETTFEKLLTLYSWPDGQVVESLPLPNQNYVWSTARSVSDHGLGIVTDNEIFLVRMTEKIEVKCLVRHPNPYFCAVAFPWSGDRIVIANDGFGIGIVDANLATCTSHFHASRDGVTSISTSPDSRWLARSTAYWEQIEIFALPSGILKRRLIGHQAAVNEVAFLPDSRRLVSAGRDGTLKIWDAESSTCLASFAWTGSDWECLTCENVPIEIGPDAPPTSPDRS